MASHEPALKTPSHLKDILKELEAREPIFHTPQFGNTRADYDALMDEGYWETGASGRRYGRQFVLDLVSTRPPHPDELSWITEDFWLRELSADTYLLTYTLRQGARVSRRATLWRQAASGWQILYHQGTLVEPT